MAEKFRPEVYESSEKLNKLVHEHRFKDLPFNDLTQGMSFYIKIGTLNESSFRASVSNMGSLHDKIYKCIKHKKEGLFEVTLFVEGEKIEVPVCESSPEAKAYFNNALADGRKVYYFDRLEEGFSLTYPIKTSSETSIRTACSLWSKKLNKRFVCIKHEEFDIFEVACLKAAQDNVTPIPMSPQAEAKI